VLSLFDVSNTFIR